MPNLRVIATSVLLLITMAVVGSAQVSFPAESGQTAPTNESGVTGLGRDSSTVNRAPLGVRHGPVVFQAGVRGFGVSNRKSPVSILQERRSTPGRGWLIFAGVLVGAYLGMQATDCEGCFLPDFGMMVIGGIVGGLVVSSAVP